MDFMGFREEIVARIWMLWRIFSASFSACLRAMCELVSRCIRCLPPICGKRFLRRLMSDVFVPAFQLFLSCGASWDFTIAYDHSVVVSSPSLLDLPVSISS
jgi:hypothetical protein